MTTNEIRSSYYERRFLELTMMGVGFRDRCKMSRIAFLISCPIFLICFWSNWIAAATIAFLVVASSAFFWWQYHREVEANVTKILELQKAYFGTQK